MLTLSEVNIFRAVPLAQTIEFQFILYNSFMHILKGIHCRLKSTSIDRSLPYDANIVLPDGIDHRLPVDHCIFIIIEGIV
ncbi:hypothetical protein D3C81_1803980 [compost metagenome]